jgi:phospholipid-transporting ATPase
MRVVQSQSSDECELLLKNCLEERKKHKKVTLVIDGTSLVYALSIHGDLFLEVGKQCETVICCRADPLQKALVVRLMKNGTGKVCLSIGDGANDVSMLQEAHIGVGIWGEEGTQAARNSDYAIRLFKHLAKLLTVHGRYSMLRNACMVQFSFYKNLGMFVVQIWYGFFNQFSAQTFFDSWYMAAYNVALLSLPPLALAFWEKDLTEEQIGHFPESYRELRAGLYFTGSTMARWMVSAGFHSLVIFFSLWLLPETIQNKGQDADLWAISTLVGIGGVWAIIARGMVGTNRFVWTNHLANFLSFIAPIALLLVTSHWPWLTLTYFGVLDWVLSTGYFWLMAVWIVAACTIPEIAFEYVRRQYWPSNWHIIAEIKKMPKGLEEISPKSKDSDDDDKNNTELKEMKFEEKVESKEDRTKLIQKSKSGKIKEKDSEKGEDGSSSD